MVFLGEICGTSMSSCLIVSLILVRMCVWCLDVTDVLVSPSSVVTEFCDSFSFCSDWDLVEPQPFSFSKKACSLLYRYAGRDEVRKLTSESASAILKKNDAAHATAKFVFIV